MTEVYKLLDKFKQVPRNIVQVVWNTTNSATDNVVFINFCGNNSDLTGKSMVLVAGKYR